MTNNGAHPPAYTHSQSWSISGAAASTITITVSYELKYEQHNRWSGNVKKQKTKKHKSYYMYGKSGYYPSVKVTSLLWKHSFAAAVII